MTRHRETNSVVLDFDELVKDPDIRDAASDAEARLALADALRAARRAAGLTQKDVAEAMGTTQSAISDLERGDTDPQLSTLQRYARATGARLDVDVRP
ncbi:helix-turn-helix transcriptional regulator [Corynebacterium sp. Q4381]|uniref:helix-turn-helix domain-containing protein n=1 Tax=Corynebacterium sp. Marseille-Q4381 TaxID=3121597 RepID=UPI002FE5FC2F